MANMKQLEQEYRTKKLGNEVDFKKKSEKIFKDNMLYVESTKSKSISMKGFLEWFKLYRETFPSDNDALDMHDKFLHGFDDYLYQLQQEERAKMIKKMQDLENVKPFPCPFCGNEKVKAYRYEPDPEEGVGFGLSHWAVECNKCDVVGPSAGDRPTAIQKWNQAKR